MDKEPSLAELYSVSTAAYSR